jgi:hypothetical protein
MSDEIIWTRYVKVVRKCRQRGELETLEEGLTSGKVAEESPDLLRAAIALSRADIGKSVPPPPTAQEMADLEAWAANVEAKHKRNAEYEKLDRKLRGLSPNRGNGKAIGPARLQKSKFSKDELLQRLRYVMDLHDEKHMGFERRYLDPNNKYHIPVCDGGISNKQVPFLAGFIVGNNDERSYDDNWKIVSEYLSRTQPGPALLPAPTKPKRGGRK